RTERCAAGALPRHDTRGLLRSVPHRAGGDDPARAGRSEPMNAFTARLVGAAALLALLWPSAAFAQDDDAFKRGLDAREKKNWNGAAMAMREAIANDPKE